MGYGLEGALTDATAANIIRGTLQPAFRAGDFNGGIERGVNDILAAVAGEYVAAPPEEQVFGSFEQTLIIPLVIIFLAIFLFGGSRGGSRRGGGRVISLGSFRSSGGGGGFGGGGASGGW